MTIAIIIPTYNSEIYIQDFMNDVMKVLGQINDIQFKFTFIDDGSSDGTVLQLKKVKRLYNNISIVVFSKNFGQTNAILAGLKHSNADAYILMSVDMQESPDLIKVFIKYWNEGFKMIIAYREFRSDNRIRRIFSKIFYFIIRIDQKAIPKGGFDYGLMDDDVAKALIKKPTNYRFLQGDIMDLGFDAKYIPCSRSRSNLTSNKFKIHVFNFNYFFDGVINTVRLPFKLMLLISAVLTILFSINVFYQLIFSMLQNDGCSFTAIYPHINLLLISLVLFLISFVVEFSYRIFDIITQKEGFVVKEFIK